MNHTDERPLRGGLVGCGFFGRIQLEAWRRMPGAQIVAACDPAVERARECAPHGYAGIAEMLDAEELDFVDIATRPDSHLAMIRASVERGLPAICQKPMATSMAESLEIVQLVRRSGVPVMIHENWRWQPWFRRAKAMIEGGGIGRPLAYHFRMRQRDGLGGEPYPNQPYFREMPRLLIYETLIHPIDTARFLFGAVRSVHARMRRYNRLIQGEDRALLTLVHEDEVDGVIDGHRFLNPDPPGPAMGDTVLEGDEGHLRILATGDIYHNGELVSKNTVTEGYKGDSARATQQHFLDCLREGREFETSAAAYLESYATVEAAYRSATEGRAVNIAEMTAATTS